MKPKEQWVTEYEAQRHLPRNQRTLIHSNGSYIEAVQLDAFKAGAEWAADIANKTEHVMHDGGCLTTMAKCYYAIKQASSNLKEIPK